MRMPISDLKPRLLCEGWIDPENEGAAGSIFLPVLRYCRQGQKVWVAEGDEYIVESRTLQEAQQNDDVKIVESIDDLELEERVLPNGAKTKLPKGGIWVVEGPAQRSDVKNANKRTYGRSIWERLIADAESPVQKTIKARGMIGHLEHPKDGRTDGKEGALVVTEATLRDDGVVWAKFELLDTPNGLILQEYTRKNVRWGVSSRGTGKVDETGRVIDESYMLETWDGVMRPSTPGAFPRAVSEGEEGLEGLDEAYPKGKGWSLGVRSGQWIASVKAKDGKGHYAIFIKKDVSLDDEDRAADIAKNLAKQVAAGKSVQDLVQEDEDAESYEEIDEAAKQKSNITASFVKVFTNFDDQPMSVLLASLAEAIDRYTDTLDPEPALHDPLAAVSATLMKAANRLAKMDEGADGWDDLEERLSTGESKNLRDMVRRDPRDFMLTLSGILSFKDIADGKYLPVRRAILKALEEHADGDPAADLLEAYDTLVEKIDTVSIEEADHGLIGNMLNVFGKTVDLAAQGNLSVEKANEMSGWLTRKITDIIDSGGGGLEESIDRALAALDDIDEDDADDDPRDKVIESLRAQLMVVSTEVDSLRETLEGTNSEVAAANESRDDALERLTEAQEKARELERKLNLAEELLAQRSADTTNGDAIEAVDEAIKAVPGLARFRKVLLRASSRDEVKELAEVLLPVIAKPKPQVLPAVPRSALPVGEVVSEDVQPPKGGTTKEPSAGAKAAAAAVRQQRRTQ